MAVQLTEKALARLLSEARQHGARRDATDAGCEGLQIRASPKGGLTWRGVCRDRSGRQRWTTHGEYPGLSIAEAREAQDAFRVAVRSGGPLPERRRRPKGAVATTTAAASAPAPVSTLTTVLDLYEHQKGHTLRSWPHGRTRITRVFGALFSRPIAALTLGDLQLAADGYRTPGEAGFAVRTLHPVFTWATHPGRDYVPREFLMLRAPVAVKRRDRHLSASEFAALLPVLQTRAAGYTAARRFAALAPAIDIRLHWHHLDLDRGHWARPTRHRKPAMRIALPPPALALLRQMPRGEARARVFPHATPHAAIMLFLLLTLARRDEAAAARWANVDLDRGHWTIPRTKNDQPHVVPLSDQAVALLRTLGPHDADALVFPAIGSGAQAANWDRESKAIARAAGIVEPFHRHDLRRSASTALGDLGELPHVIKAALNHVVTADPIDARYNRSRNLPERTAAVQRLADMLDELTDGARVARDPAFARVR